MSETSQDSGMDPPALADAVAGPVAGGHRAVHQQLPPLARTPAGLRLAADLARHPEAGVPLAVGFLDVRRIPRLRLHGLGPHRPLAVRRPGAG